VIFIMDPFLSQGTVIATSMVAPNVTADLDQVINLSPDHEAEYLIPLRQDIGNRRSWVVPIPSRIIQWTHWSCAGSGVLANRG
jgi:hypothetical protein